MNFELDEKVEKGTEKLANDVEFAIQLDMMTNLVLELGGLLHRIKSMRIDKKIEIAMGLVECKRVIDNLKKVNQELLREVR